MVETYALYLIIFHLERILPIEQFRFIKECINTCKWGMDDLCFTCKKPFKKVLGLRLPKKTSLYNIHTIRNVLPSQSFFDKPDRRECHLPFCKKCVHKVYSQPYRGRIVSLLDLICMMNGKKSWHYRSLRYGVESREPWDPVKKYDQLVRHGNGFKICDVTRIENGIVYVNVTSEIIYLPSVIKNLYPSIAKIIKEFGYELNFPCERPNFFEGDIIMPYKSINYP